MRKRQSCRANLDCLTKLIVLSNLLGKRRPLVGGNLSGEFGLRTIPATDPFRGEELIAAR